MLALGCAGTAYLLRRSFHLQTNVITLIRRPDIVVLGHRQTCDAAAVGCALFRIRDGVPGHSDLVDRSDTLRRTIGIGIGVILMIAAILMRRRHRLGSRGPQLPTQEWVGKPTWLVPKISVLGAFFLCS